MHAPLTVIIPTYNRPDATNRALESLARQRIEPAEVIIVDDGSSSAFEIRHSWPFRSKLLRHPTNLGAAAARNTGLAASKTDWITFLDSDDYLLPDTLHLRLAEAEAAGASALHGCSWVEFDALTGKPLARTEPQNSHSLDDHFAGVWFSPGTCLIANRHHLISTGVTFDETLRRLEDYDWACRLADAGMILQTSAIIGAAISRERSMNPVVVEEAAVKILEKWRSKSLSRSRWRAMQAYLAHERAAAHYFAGNHSRFLVHLIRSFVFKPRLGLHPSPNMRKRFPIANADLAR